MPDVASEQANSATGAPVAMLNQPVTPSTLRSSAAETDGAVWSTSKESLSAPWWPASSVAVQEMAWLPSTITNESPAAFSGPTSTPLSVQLSETTPTPSAVATSTTTPSVPLESMLNQFVPL